MIQREKNVKNMHKPKSKETVVTFLIIKRNSASDLTEIDHSFLFNPPTVRLFRIVLLKKSQIDDMLLQCSKCLSYKITPESEWSSNGIGLRFLTVIGLLRPKLSNQRVVKCSGHVSLYLNIIDHFNGKYTWGLPCLSLNKISLNKIVREGNRKKGKMNENWYCHLVYWINWWGCDSEWREAEGSRASKTNQIENLMIIKVISAVCL